MCDETHHPCRQPLLRLPSKGVHRLMQKDLNCQFTPSVIVLVEENPVVEDLGNIPLQLLVTMEFESFIPSGANVEPHVSASLRTSSLCDAIRAHHHLPVVILGSGPFLDILKTLCLGDIGHSSKQ